MKKFVIIIFYSFFLLLLGRQLNFLPIISLPDNKTQSSLSVDEIRELMIEYISEFEGDYSIYYEDLVSGDAFGINHNSIMTAASLNKVPIIFYLYSLADKREIDLEEKITLLKSDIQDYGTGKLRYEKPGGVYTLKKLAELAFKHSDNTAVHLLTIRLGENNVQYFVDSLGLSATNIAFNETSPRDFGMLISKFYNNELMSEALKQELMDYMSDTEFENRIPKYLENAKVYHKIGDSDNMVHDGGIIVPENGSPFVLVVMTQGIVEEENAHDTIGKIAKEIYDKR
jgi:beta-lactamase class A